MKPSTNWYFQLQTTYNYKLQPYLVLCLFQMIHESSLMQLEGHHHQIEYLVADCNAIISMCLGGMINIWDPYTGEKLAQIDRTR